MSSIRFETRDGIGYLTFDTPDSKVNILSAAALGELDALLKTIASDRSLRALILRSAKKKIFIAGADIKEIESISQASEGEAKARAGQTILDALEDLPFPSVALLNGTTLGGGLELALAATYRIAAYADDTQIGLPEVKLGIFPGFGGTWRLPARTGLQKGLEWITQGKTGVPAQARSAGIVDALTHESELEAYALDFLKKKDFKKIPSEPKRGPLAKFLEDTPFGRGILRRETRKAILKATKGQYPAPLKAADVVIDNWKAPRKAALEHEAREFGKLAEAGGHKALIRTFYLMERYKKEKWSDAKGVLPDKAAVLGAGVMGGGIAQLVSSAGIQVRMKDMNAEALLLGLRSAAKVYGDLVKKRKLSKYEAESRLGLILPALDYSGFSRARVVVEAVVENLEVKKKVFSELGRVTAIDTVLASNTSSLPVSRMADGVENPGRVVGMHFFNPVHKMPLVEIIRAEQTSEETIASIVDFSRKLKKTPIVVKDAPGFLVNRLLLPYLNEAGHLFEEGQSPGRVDAALYDFGMPMAAFRLLDEIGLDVGAKVSHILFEAFGERMKPSPVLDRMVEKKWLGKKSGTGFYLYGSEKSEKSSPNPGLAVPSPVGSSASADIVERCVFAMINEAAYCLEEKIVREAADVDIAMLLGTGFPPFRSGGLLRHADSIGSKRIVERLNEFEEKTKSPRFKPAPLLARMAQTGAPFHSA